MNDAVFPADPKFTSAPVHNRTIRNPAIREANTNTILLRELANAIDGQAAAATFACGGSVPISETDKSVLPSKQTAPTEPHCQPITLIWDLQNESAMSKMVFPLQPYSAADPALFRLLQSCTPATFGLQGHDVLDVNYRRASKLDVSDFLTNFHPHDCGIIDAIYQVLLPSTLPERQGPGIGQNGVRAELYKLNVGTSLLVCLD